MYYYTQTKGAESRLICEMDDGYYDLTQANTELTGFRDLIADASMADSSIDEIAAELVASAEAVQFSPESDAGRPVVPDEVWAAGVTYAISQESREGEGSISDTYIDAYEAERPEVYFKATPTRTVGPNDSIGVRLDSEWDVAEPELALVLYQGEIVGYTVGNDVCSREIERANLLYLPQSKIYQNSCAVGPAVASPAAVGDPHDLEMRMTIERDGTSVFEGRTSTSEMVRTCEELVSYFRRCNYIPEMTVFLTGTSIVPPKDVTLREDDVVRIEIEDIGVLQNPVETVG